MSADECIDKIWLDHLFPITEYVVTEVYLINDILLCEHDWCRDLRIVIVIVLFGHILSVLSVTPNIPNIFTDIHYIPHIWLTQYHTFIIYIISHLYNIHCITYVLCATSCWFTFHIRSVFFFVLFFLSQVSWVYLGINLLSGYQHINSRDHFLYVTSQWEMTLQGNIVCHWLCACTEWSLYSMLHKVCTWFCCALFS